MPAHKKVDRHLLHEMLWETKDRYGYISYLQADLAEQCGVTYSTMSLIFKEMMEEGRMKREGWKYRVYDPSPYRWTSTPQTDKLF